MNPFRRVVLIWLLCLASFAASASVAEAALTISQAVFLSSTGNPDDDLSASYYIRGVLDGLLQTGAYQCSTPLPSRSEFTRLAKETARKLVVQERGDEGFARLIAISLEALGCVPSVPSFVEKPRAPKGK